MPDCKKLDPLVTPYVDGEHDAPSRAEVDAHAQVCPPCHSRLAAERTVHELLVARRATLKKDCAPAALRARCGLAGGRVKKAYDPLSWRARLRPLALAAALVVVVGGAFLYQLTDRSARVMAAELVADHIKCFGVNRLLGTSQSAALVEGSMASSFSWRVQLPAQPQQIGLELVGARPCLYGEGRIAHIMYRHNGHPVSVFMLPRTERPDEVVDVMGHEAAIWSAGNRTFVLVAREPREEIQRVASFVHAALH